LGGERRRRHPTRKDCLASHCGGSGVRRQRTEGTRREGSGRAARAGRLELGWAGGKAGGQAVAGGPDAHVLRE